MSLRRGPVAARPGEPAHPLDRPGLSTLLEGPAGADVPPVGVPVQTGEAWEREGTPETSPGGV